MIIIWFSTFLFLLTLISYLRRPMQKVTWIKTLRQRAVNARSSALTTEPAELSPPLDGPLLFARRLGRSVIKPLELMNSILNQWAEEGRCHQRLLDLLVFRAFLLIALTMSAKVILTPSSNRNDHDDDHDHANPQELIIPIAIGSFLVVLPVWYARRLSVFSCDDSFPEVNQHSFLAASIFECFAFSLLADQDPAGLECQKEWNHLLNSERRSGVSSLVERRNVLLDWAFEKLMEIQTKRARFEDGLPAIEFLVWGGAMALYLGAIMIEIVAAHPAVISGGGGL